MQVLQVQKDYEVSLFFVGVNEHARMSIIVAKILFSKSLLVSRFSSITMLPVLWR